MPKKPSDQNLEKPNKLPEDLESCHGLIRDLYAKIAELEKQLSRRNRVIFGNKSAKVDHTLLTGTGKVIHQQTRIELEEESRRLNVIPDNK